MMGIEKNLRPSFGADQHKSIFMWTNEDLRHSFSAFAPFLERKTEDPPCNLAFEKPPVS